VVSTKKKRRRKEGQGKEGKRKKRKREKNRTGEGEGTQKLGKRKRVELGGMVLMKRDNLCSSCNSSVMPLYHRARPVLATLPAYIFVFVRSPVPGAKERGTYRRLDLGMPLRGDAGRRN